MGRLTGKNTGSGDFRKQTPHIIAIALSGIQKWQRFIVTSGGTSDVTDM
jgi:hypothetical protein